MLYLTNTLSGKKEVFKPHTSDKVTLYVCGITPYDVTHVGHGRCYVVFDLLYRVLRELDYTVNYCRNYTDIDDKLLKKAQERFGDEQRYPEIAKEVINDFQQMMRKLNCVQPTNEPRVTEHMPAIINFIEALIKQGYAYESHGDVYFIIEKFPSYGKLSHQKIEELRARESKEVCLSMTNDYKRDPLDFALWKAEGEGQFWKSPWGWGRPGWHIECSALAYKFLGEQLDLHGGGIDIIFPHHENEIAQSEARFDKQFVQYWLHNGLINIGKEKMSKSLGNIYALNRLLAEYDPMVVRFYFFSHHYRTPIEFSFEGLKAAQKAYQRLCRTFEKVTPESDKSLRELMQTHNATSLIGQMIAMLCDDLNTAGMFGIVFDNITELQQDKKLAAVVKGLFTKTIGLTLEPLPEKKIEVTPEIQKLLEEREHARKVKDFKKADTIRAQLEAMGFEVQDKKIK